ncbi:SDR family oxidoreductase [Cupriavidus necator]|uniref:SDR family oxidoreductase n=1 Tax=Cupriavidus necator TaxID=106590 RepID=UPI003B8A7025
MPYSASKGGVHAATVCMALKLAKSGVRVNCVSPGALDNGVRAIQRNAQPLSERDEIWMQKMYASCRRTYRPGASGTRLLARNQHRPALRSAGAIRRMAAAVLPHAPHNATAKASLHSSSHLVV